MANPSETIPSRREADSMHPATYNDKHYYFTPGMGANYCSQHLSCLSVRSHISKTTRPNFTNFSVYVIRGRGLVFVWWQCNTSGFGDVIFSHSGAHFTLAVVTGCLTVSHSSCNSFYVCLSVFLHLWTMHRAKSAILDCLVLICCIICIQNYKMHSSDKAFQLYTLFHATAWYLPSYTVITAVFLRKRQLIKQKQK